MSQASQQPKPLNPAPEDNSQGLVPRPTEQPVQKKRRFNRPAKLSIEKLTSTEAISSIVSTGRTTASEYREGKHAQMLSTVIRRAIRWAGTVAPNHTPAQFAVESRALSSKREVRAYLSNVRLAQLRGAHVGEEEDVDVDDNMEIEQSVGQENRPFQNVAVAADAPDMDEIMLMEQEMELQSKAPTVSKQVQASDPPEEQDLWDEEDMFMDEDNDPSFGMPAMPSMAPKMNTHSGSGNRGESAKTFTNPTSVQPDSAGKSGTSEEIVTTDKLNNDKPIAPKDSSTSANNNNKDAASPLPESAARDSSPSTEEKSKAKGPLGEKDTEQGGPEPSQPEGQDKESSEKPTSEKVSSNANEDNDERQNNGANVASKALADPKPDPKPTDGATGSDDADDTDDDDEIEVRRRKPRAIRKVSDASGPGEAGDNVGKAESRESN